LLPFSRKKSERSLSLYNEETKWKTTEGISTVFTDIFKNESSIEPFNVKGKKKGKTTVQKVFLLYLLTLGNEKKLGKGPFSI
jgi:hypothetical protein